MARLSPDWVDNYFTYGYDPTRRRLFLFDDIDEETVERFVMGLELLKGQSKEDITIFMSSCGGEQYDMWAAYDAIRCSHEHTIRIKVLGKIMSAAPLILAAGDERYSFPHTSFMFHEEAYELEERHGNAKITIAHYEELEKQYARAMADRTKKNYAWWYNQVNRSNSGIDKYHTPADAMVMGLIDGILRTDGTIDHGKKTR